MSTPPDPSGPPPPSPLAADATPPEGSGESAPPLAANPSEAQSTAVARALPPIEDASVALLAEGPSETPLGPARPSAVGPLISAAITTAVVTAVSYLTPDRFAATLVGVSFLAATWWLVLRHDELTVRSYGLSLGGLLEPSALDVRRLARSFAGAAAWALLLMVLVLPPFWIGYRIYWHPHAYFTFRPPASVFDEVAGQLLVIALPEEAFFRGFLQTSLDRAWAPRVRILGADVGPGLIVSAAIFAVGHLLTIRHPARLAVFFPALLFGWLRARTRGVGAAVLFHAACNIFSAALMRGYGMLP